MTKRLGSLMSRSNSLKIKSSPSGATFFGVPIYTLGCDKLRIRDIEYVLTPELYKASSFTGYIAKTTKSKNDILLMKKL